MPACKSIAGEIHYDEETKISGVDIALNGIAKLVVGTISSHGGPNTFEDWLRSTGKSLGNDNVVSTFAKYLGISLRCYFLAQSPSSSPDDLAIPSYGNPAVVGVFR